ncbi:MAG: methyltransferase domain-containing protein [Rhizomicrobium sp.]
MTASEAASKTAAYFDSESPTWDDRYVRQSHFRTRLETLRNWLAALPPNLSVLDFGCGTGVASAQLASLGHRPTGVDISEKMVETSRAALQRSGIPEDRFTFEHISPDGRGAYLEKTYDGMVSLGVFEYTDDPAALLKLLTTRIRPGGFLIMSGPNRRSPVRWMEHFVFRHPRYFAVIPGLKRLASPDSYKHYQKHQFVAGELAALLDSCGMTLERTFYHGGPSVLGGLEHTPWLGMTMILQFKKRP